VLRDANLPNSIKSLVRWFDTSAFEAPAPFTFGNAGRGIVRADGRINFDFSMGKSFQFAESASAQFRAETFNAFNHPDFGLPGTVLGAAGFDVMSSATDARVLQFGLRFRHRRASAAIRAAVPPPTRGCCNSGCRSATDARVLQFGLRIVF
jgi:hypothetical protein